MKTFLTSIACVFTLVATPPSYAQAPEPVSIVVFGAPSLGAFLPPVIKAQKLDEKNGLAIKFEERTPMPIRRSSIPVSSRSAAARRC